MNSTVEQILCKASGIVLTEGEGLCDACHGSGRYRIRFGHDYCERRDTTHCQKCDGSGKVNVAAPYGYCPTCGSVGVMRERLFPAGNDICENGHEYPSRKAVKK